MKVNWSLDAMIFPIEILQIIFGYLGPVDMCFLSTVCKRFNKVASSDAIWKPFSHPDWDSQPIYDKIPSYKLKYLTWIRSHTSHHKSLKELSEKPKTTQSNPFQPYDFLFKAVMVGDAGVGKTSIHNRILNDRFDSIVSNIGVEFGSKTLMVEDKYIKMQLWDTAGQERYRALTRSYYRSTAGFILVYDMSSRQTFTNIQKWVDEIEQYSTQEHSYILIGNKSDTESWMASRAVTKSEGEALAESLGATFIEASARNNINLDKVIEILVVNILHMHRDGFFWNWPIGFPKVPPSVEDVKRMIKWSEDSKLKREILKPVISWRLTSCIIS